MSKTLKKRMEQKGGEVSKDAFTFPVSKQERLAVKMTEYLDRDPKFNAIKAADRIVYGSASKFMDPKIDRTVQKFLNLGKEHLPDPVNSSQKKVRFKKPQVK
jgi:hypothetical protein